ncbi:alpha/beta hydrolase [Streptomyces sp. RB6PN25]|uniref:Alpha/beta hydrolase n=1 Tax=Streptomyces humicola TaxID=2953240 RepID=A0ABT1PST1_9ACTN|nr:alpha/beta hydrolase [Streptomyces humicola]MCQ4080736.1 alpha/beta hydrolase [Streptomyces humicola]
MRRIDVTGAGGVQLAAWDYTDQHKPRDEHAERTDADACAVDGIMALFGDDEFSEYGETRTAVLLLHGLMGRASHWAATARALAARYRPVALDQRGHGRSDHPDGPYSREAYIADAAAAIEQLGLAPAVVIGHSMGALTAWQLAARRPDLVRALVICDMRASALGEARSGSHPGRCRSRPSPTSASGSGPTIRRWSARVPPVAHSSPR